MSKSYKSRLEKTSSYFPEEVLSNEVKGDNVLKRNIYCELELLRMDVESDKDFFQSEAAKTFVDTIIKRTSLLNLKYNAHSKSRNFIAMMINKIDIYIRGITVVAVLMSFAVIFRYIIFVI